MVKWTKGGGSHRVLTKPKLSLLAHLLEGRLKALILGVLLKKWVWYKSISLSTLPFMLCEPTLAYFSIWTPKLCPIYLQTCFCLLRKLEERTFDILVYAQFFLCWGLFLLKCLIFGGVLTWLLRWLLTLWIVSWVIDHLLDYLNCITWSVICKALLDWKIINTKI